MSFWVSAQSLQIDSFTLPTLCQDDYFNLYFSALAVQLPIKVQLSDATGSFQNPNQLTAGSTSPIAVNIPPQAVSGGSYKLRLVSSGASPVTSAPSNSFPIHQSIYAVLEPSNYIVYLTEGDTTSNIKLTTYGLPPYTYAINNGPQVQTSLNTQFLPFSPLINTSYSITYADNPCPFFTRLGIVNVQILPLAKRLVSCFAFSGNVLDGKKRNHGIASGGGFSTDKFGHPSSSYLFDGNAYVTCPADGLANATYTLSFRANASTGTIFSLGSSEKLSFATSNLIYSTNGTSYNVPIQPYINQWVHYVIVRSSTGFRVLVNNTEILNQNGQSSVSYSPDFTLKVGADASNNNRFIGKVDDLQIYKGVLTYTEVKNLFLSSTDCFDATKYPCLKDATIDFTYTNLATNGFEVVQVENRIIGQAEILSGFNQTFDAQKSIILEPGFQAKTGSVFTAKAGWGCSN